MWGKWAERSTTSSRCTRTATTRSCRRAWSPASGTWRRSCTSPTSTRTARRRASCPAASRRSRTTSWTRTRSSPPRSAARCSPTGPTCGTGAATSPVATLPVRARRGVPSRERRLVRLRRLPAPGRQQRVGRSSSTARPPTDLALFGIPRPGHAYWNAATVDAMAHRHPRPRHVTVAHVRIGPLHDEDQAEGGAAVTAAPSSRTPRNGLTPAGREGTGEREGRGGWNGSARRSEPTPGGPGAARRRAAG